MIHALQSKALASLRIRELEKAERNPEFPRRFTTDLTKSWKLIFSGAKFDEL